MSSHHDHGQAQSPLTRESREPSGGSMPQGPFPVQGQKVPGYKCFGLFSLSFVDRFALNKKEIDELQETRESNA
jgi:hypothetical protein